MSSHGGGCGGCGHAGESHPVADGIEQLLALVCRELDMETGFIGRVVDGQRPVRRAVGPGLSGGDSDPYDETYCALIAEGGLGPAISDVSLVPRLHNMPITTLP